MKGSVLGRSPLRLLYQVAGAILLVVVAAARADDGELPPLTTVENSPRLPGKFIWADLVTDDVLKARSFYAQLFGWQFWGVGNYSIAVNDSQPLAGMFQKSRPANDPKARPRWFGYISVPSVGKAERAVAKAGGRVLAPPQNFPRRGEQAVFADREGAIFGVMRSSAGDPEDLLAEPGDWIWIQLLSRDPRNAAEFYRAVAGYDIVENNSANRLNDYVLVSKGFARATVRTLVTKREDVNPTWLPYVRVKSVSETVRKAKELGGSVLIEPKPEVFEGGVAVLADPGGAAIGILEWRPDLMKGAR
ncbi:MAG: VOC family protein [Verrucomicrobia subdivision 3 bacterium]|nr:VOC family protein [Limisphaerales bacterium]